MKQFLTTNGCYYNMLYSTLPPLSETSNGFLRKVRIGRERSYYIEEMCAKLKKIAREVKLFFADGAYKRSECESESGTRIILPSSFTGGSRYMMHNYMVVSDSATNVSCDV